MSKKSADLRKRLRDELSCTPYTPCNAHSCLDCGKRTANKYWDRIARMKGPGKSRKLTALQFCVKNRQLLAAAEVDVARVRKLKNEVTAIAQRSRINHGRWCGLVYVCPMIKNRGKCIIVGTLHVAAFKLRELREMKAAFAKSEVVDFAWVDDVDDWEISDRRDFIAASPEIYHDPIWVGQLKSIKQADCLIVNSENRLSDFQVAR